MNLEDPLLIHMLENVVILTETTNNAKLINCHSWIIDIKA